MKRLYTFGCSFTNYNWPTWADLYGLEFDYFFNWAYPGLGNKAIAERIAECHARNIFTEEDTVIVQWSSPYRHDWMRTDYQTDTDLTAWKTHGSIFSKENEKTFDHKWLSQFWDEKAYFLHTLNHIILAQELLNSTGVTWMMTSMNDIKKVGNDLSPRTMGGDYQPEELNLKNFWDVDPTMMFYKEAIWDRYDNKWVDPIMGVIGETPEFSWWFETDKKNKNIFKTNKGKWEESHPTVGQHGIWLLKLKDRLDLEVKLIDTQIAMIKEFNSLKEQTKTYNEFEAAVSTTDWFLHRQWRGF